MTQHCGLQGNVSDFRKCVWPIKISPFVSFLYWRMDSHTEPHVCRCSLLYVKKLSQAALAGDMPEPRTLIGAWKEMLEIRREQIKNPNY